MVQSYFTNVLCISVRIVYEYLQGFWRIVSVFQLFPIALALASTSCSSALLWLWSKYFIGFVQTLSYCGWWLPPYRWKFASWYPFASGFGWCSWTFVGFDDSAVLVFVGHWPLTWVYQKSTHSVYFCFYWFVICPYLMAYCCSHSLQMAIFLMKGPEVGHLTPLNIFTSIFEWSRLWQLRWCWAPACF